MKFLFLFLTVTLIQINAQAVERYFTFSVLKTDVPTAFDLAKTQNKVLNSTLYASDDEGKLRKCDVKIGDINVEEASPNYYFHAYLECPDQDYSIENLEEYISRNLTEYTGIDLIPFGIDFN